ncbi:hypothetical protein [Mycolicibacterium sp.]|uniref:hypothetical protein n=1 Tax=Mycolicibacterium sp. TaxID=2320850 RepID=UPI001A31BEDC|nr:hypothetical protein [Mycolicibacterium sp.]MBJ7337910.1 hypothetical protein [Mycolicibacterium sp.]
MGELSHAAGSLTSDRLEKETGSTSRAGSGRREQPWQPRSSGRGLSLSGREQFTNATDFGAFHALRGFAALPLNDPAAAAVERCGEELGFVGALTAGSIDWPFARRRTVAELSDAHLHAIAYGNAEAVLRL